MSETGSHAVRSRGGERIGSAALARAGLLVLVLLSGIASLAVGGSGDPVAGSNAMSATGLDPARVGWSKLRYSGTKFGLSVTTDVELSRISAQQAELVLLESDDVELMEPERPELLRLVQTFSFIGRFARSQVVFRADAEALQRLHEETGQRRQRFKAYRFAEDGVLAVRRNPLEGEEERAPSTWSAESRKFSPYPPDLEGGLVVSEPSLLFYIVSAAGLRAEGDSLRVYMYSHNHLHLLELTVEGQERVKVEHVEELQQQRGERTRRGRVDTLRIALAAQTIDDVDDSFSFAGLDEEIKVFVDRVTRVPVLIKGKLERLGRLTFRLERVVLNGPPATQMGGDAKVVPAT